jgi:hypothetical protein
MKIYDLLNSYQIQEDELRKILDFVTPVSNHDQVYSPQISKHLMSSCIAFEGICKEIGVFYNSSTGNIGDYKALMLGRFPKITDFEIQITIGNRILKPFENWDKASLSWWNDYTELKHNYFQNISSGRLLSCMNALGAYLLAILYYGYLENNNTPPSIPHLLAPSLLSPKDYSNNNFESGGMFYQYPLLV